MIKKFPHYVALSALIFLMSFPAAAEDLSKRDWSTQSAKPLTANPPATDDVNAVISKALNADWEVKACNYIFVDPARDGTFRLIAAFDGSGYHTCNRVVAIEKQGTKFVVANDWQTRLAQRVQNILVDIKHDGHLEIIIPEAWSKYELGHCMAMWQGVYRWEDGHFVNHSTDYLELYKARQQQLTEEIPRLRDPTCDQMELDRISRFLTIDPKAGFAQAVQWMGDSRSFMRRQAAAVFANINDGESRKNLATLKDDPDALVAESAKAYLESAGK